MLVWTADNLGDMPAADRPPSQGFGTKGEVLSSARREAMSFVTHAMRWVDRNVEHPTEDDYLKAIQYRLAKRGVK